MKTLEILQNTGAYLEKFIELKKLETIEEVSFEGAHIISTLIIALVALIALIFTSLFVAFYLGEYYSSYSIGFGIVSAFYIGLSFFVLAIRKSIILKKIRNEIIKTLNK